MELCTRSAPPSTRRSTPSPSARPTSRALRMTSRRSSRAGGFSRSPAVPGIGRHSSRRGPSRWSRSITTRDPRHREDQAYPRANVRCAGRRVCAPRVEGSVLGRLCRVLVVARPALQAGRLSASAAPQARAGRARRLHGQPLCRGLELAPLAPRWRRQYLPDPRLDDGSTHEVLKNLRARLARAPRPRRASPSTSTTGSPAIA